MILVTGGTGLVGSHLLYKLLSKGYKVKALKRVNSNINVVKKVFAYYSDIAEELFSNIQWINGDMLDYNSIDDAVKGIEEIYHCAAAISFSPKDKETVLDNIKGTHNIVNAALANDVKKICFVSSIAALGKSINNKAIDENCKWSSKNERSIYAYSKHHSEMEVWRGVAEGLDAVVVNPSIILGPGFWNSGSSSFYNVIWNGLKFYTTGITGFVDVNDVVHIMLELMSKNIVNERYIVNAENISYKAFFEEIARNLNVQPPKIKVSKTITEIAWRIAKIASLFKRNGPFISKESARASQSISYYSNKKIKDITGYDFIPIKDTIKDNCNKFLNDLN